MKNEPRLCFRESGNVFGVEAEVGKSKKNGEEGTMTEYRDTLEFPHPPETHAGCNRVKKYKYSI